MSGLEVVAIAASVVSAFNAGAQLARAHKKRYAKTRGMRRQHEEAAEAPDRVVVQDMLYASLEEGERVVTRQFLDEQRALGRHSQLLRSGDERAKQELLSIAESLQAEVISSLEKMGDQTQPIMEMAQLMALHAMTITKRYEAVRSISELRQRVELRIPLPRLPADTAVSTSISQDHSDESIARTFVTAAANLNILDPTAHSLLAVPAVSNQQQTAVSEWPNASTTWPSYAHLIPEVHAQDIDNLTLADQDLYQDDAHEITISLPQVMPPVSSSSSFSRVTPSSEFLPQPFEGAGQSLPRMEHPQIYGKSANNASTLSAFSPPAYASSSKIAREVGIDKTLDDHYNRRYCTGAIAAQEDLFASFTQLQLPILPGSSKLHPSWKCNACDFKVSDPDGKLFQRIDFAHGIRYRFPFCAKSHASYSHPPDVFRPRYTYSCLFCTAEARASALHVGSDALMAHIGTKHRTNVTPEVRVKTHTIVGRLAGRDESWDVNIPDQSTTRKSSPVGKWLLHAVTSLPGAGGPVQSDRPLQTVRNIPSDSGYASSLSQLKLVQRSEQVPHSEMVEDNVTSHFADTSSIGTPMKEGYVSQLVDCLMTDLPILSRTQDSSGGLLQNSLTRLLETFSQRLGFAADRRDLWDVMYFVATQKDEIRAALLNRLGSSLDTEEDVPRDGEPVAGLHIGSWIEETVESNSELDPDPEMIKIESFGDEAKKSEKHSYRELVTETWSYKWLVASLRSKFLLQYPSDDVQSAIGGLVRRKLYTLGSCNRMSRYQKPHACTVRLTMDWELCSFLDAQKYDCAAPEAIIAALVVTGDAQSAQGCTCAQYMRQTWPLSGEALLESIHSAFARPEREHYSRLPDGTKVTLTLEPAVFEFYGPVESIAEVAEQLSWLGSALRTSDRTTGLKTCVPSITIATPDQPKVERTVRGVGLDADFHISFDLSCIECENSKPGFCWSSMFRNTTIVHGYPILRRPLLGTGFEATIDILARLVRTKSLQNFDDRMYLMGFSSLLVSAGLKDGLVHWHHTYKASGDKISYLDIDRSSTSQISWTEAEGGRHIVGWSSEVTCHAGALDSNLDVRRSHLPPPHAGCYLEKATITGGRGVTAGVTIGLGIRDSPLHLSPEKDTYDRRLQLLSGQYVVFWDVDTNRGWLVNGPSALLYLVLSSLHFEKSFSSPDQFLFDPAHLQEANHKHTADSAREILQNQANRWSRVYERRTQLEREADSYAAPVTHTKKDDKGDFIRFENRVDEMYGVLMKMLTWQEDRLGRNGYKVKNRMRKHLEGWDFADVTRGTTIVLHPKVATLQALGFGWVDFVRSINAVTLLGKGFGNLMQATEHECQRWTKVPCGRYFLAVSLRDLARITEDYGDPDSQPTQVCDDLTWSLQADMFAKCESGEQRHADPVQTLWPKGLKHTRKAFERWSQPVRCIHIRDLPASGGVIFGHPFHFPYTWGNDGDPVERQASLNEYPGDTDSGLGKSISTPENTITTLSNVASSASNNGGELDMRSSHTVEGASDEVGVADQSVCQTSGHDASPEGGKDQSYNQVAMLANQSARLGGKTWLQRTKRSVRAWFK